MPPEGELALGEVLSTACSTAAPTTPAMRTTATATRAVIPRPLKGLRLAVGVWRGEGAPYG